jgi:hypothetical protein
VKEAEALDLRESSVADLLRLYREILRELFKRKVIRTANAPAGDYAEHLVTRALGGVIAPNSEKSWDVRTEAGRRVQVKSRLVSDPLNRGQRQLSAIRSFDFEDLAIVLFDSDFAVITAVLIPAELAKSNSAYRAHVNGFTLFATDALLHHPDAVDITESVRATADGPEILAAD